MLLLPSHCFESALRFIYLNITCSNVLRILVIPCVNFLSSAKFETIQLIKYVCAFNEFYVMEFDHFEEVVEILDCACLRNERLACALGARRKHGDKQKYCCHPAYPRIIANNK